MSAAHDYSRYADLADAPAPDADVTTLTGRLDAKLTELASAGCRVQWIEVSEPEMIALFVEGGDEAIQLDPDPAVDKAWYGDFEVRPTIKSCIWIYVEGEVEDQISAHIVS
ncbi:MAG: hypothetical protein JWR47_3738 [Phenylobacterium sp.]|jgi:hypothetical protein|nr:hypothetical protein [Phenylobacterium sp.]MDB5437481.1 hypothetical protein [Phenylobacterium sp.]MDB5461755.1 hypothetical protein [Phenylobacterium sp.]